MTTPESHKSVAIELPTYKVLKTVAEREFRTPSKQIAYMLHKHYPDLFQNLEEIEEDNSLKSVRHALIADDTRSMYRTWQLLICLWKNRELGSLSIQQIVTAMNYKFLNTDSVVSKPISSGLVERTPDNCYKLSEFGRFVAKDLSDTVPIRLTDVILNQYRQKYGRMIHV